MHTYEVRPRKIAASISFPTCCHSLGCGMTGRIMQPGYAMHSSHSHDAVIRVYDDAGNVLETHEHVGDFKEP